MRKTNNLKNKKFVFIIWQDVIPVFCGSFLISVWIIGPFMGDAGFPWVIVTASILSTFSFQIASFNEESISIKRVILPPRKIKYEQIKSIEYRTPSKSPVTLVIKKDNYAWWKYFSYYIYLPTKYTWSTKKTFFLLRYLKKHIPGKIEVYDENDTETIRLCKKINEYY